MSFFKKKKIDPFFLFPFTTILVFLWQMIRGLRISDQCLRKREPGARDKKYSLWYKNVNPWHPLTFSAFVEWSLPEKNNSLQKKKAKLIPSSVSCFSVLRGSTMKRFVSTSVSPTFVGCWRDSSRWQRRGQTSKQRWESLLQANEEWFICHMAMHYRHWSPLKLSVKFGVKQEQKTLMSVDRLWKNWKMWNKLKWNQMGEPNSVWTWNYGIPIVQSMYTRWDKIRLKTIILMIIYLPEIKMY